MEFDLIRNIPKQVEKFFELQHFDLEAPLEPQTQTRESVFCAVDKTQGSSEMTLQTHNATQEMFTLGMSTIVAQHEEEIVVRHQEEEKGGETPQMNTSPSGMGAPINFDPVNYKKNILMYIHLERLRITCEAVAAGIQEETIETLLKEENVNDFYLDNIKVRLGIIDKKPERAPRKTVV